MANTEELEVFYHLDDSDPYFASYRKIKKNKKCLKGNFYLPSEKNPPHSIEN